jgi:hypothetical protein
VEIWIVENLALPFDDMKPANRLVKEITDQLGFTSD